MASSRISKDRRPQELPHPGAVSSAGRASPARGPSASRRGRLSAPTALCPWVCALALLTAPRTAAALELPGRSGWYVSGTASSDYAVRLDEIGGRNGSACAVLDTRVPRVSGFVTLAQRAPAASLKGRRLRMSAWVRPAAVEGWAGLWMRIDGAEKGKGIAFDNMQDRPIEGSGDWTRHSIVLDVPEEGEVLYFGIILEGPGTVRVDDFEFELVGPEVPVTDFFVLRWREDVPP